VAHKNDKQYLTANEVASRFGVDAKTVYKLAQDGEMPSFKFGNQWRFDEEDLKVWVENMKRENIKKKREI
jgi:excisionase family DNA binding protein